MEAIWRMHIPQHYRSTSEGVARGVGVDVAGAWTVERAPWQLAHVRTSSVAAPPQLIDTAQ